jgi:ankyrin repeat protein
MTTAAIAVVDITLDLYIIHRLLRQQGVGYQALLMAAYKGHTEASAMLIRAGADVNYQNRKVLPYKR